MRFLLHSFEQGKTVLLEIVAVEEIDLWKEDNGGRAKIAALFYFVSYMDIWIRLLQQISD